MSNLRSEPQNLGDLGLSWGDIKRKVGINKVGGKIAKAHKDVAKAITVPSKKNLKKAEDSAKPVVGVALPALDFVAPGAGTAASIAWNAGRAKVAKKKAKDALNKAKRQAAAAEPEAATAAATAAAGGGGGSGGGSVSVTTLAPVDEGASQAPESEKKTNWLGWAAGGLLAVKAISLVV